MLHAAGQARLLHIPQSDNTIRMTSSDQTVEGKLSDTELARRVRAGDQSAYRCLIDRHAPMIFRLTRRFAKQPADAEDLAQDIFVKAYQAMDRFTDHTDFSAWLYTIGANHCRDYAKNVRRQVDPLSRVESAKRRPEMREAAQQELSMERSERAEQLRSALDQLSPDYATAFLMKYEEGLRYRDMAERLDATVGALKVRVHRARKELKEILGEAI